MALYRKYRPATFAEVVGQEQVTKPLSAALDSGRINHAYLFSGPRGCGKTSSARIMARSLNCVHGPTSTPCGTCPSCLSLAPGAPGNLDVTELDAASHNGVEDMRELRERAQFAPAESRYRIYIIDEAHMISASGANALLKVVEEPPEHVIFIFATTEPEKIIGTIRSRTHHYPFRLLTPPAMKGLLQRTVAAEGVHVDEAVYPMVISAGGGSPRDTLSILDQLLAGAGPEGLTYEAARPLLGVTDETLLDDAIAALAEGDKAALFGLVDRVIDAGHEPRRFATDLLDRLRDLMVLQAVPDALDAGLVDAPTDRGPVLTAQAQQFSGPQLTHMAGTVSEQLPSLRGATSPRLLLEVLCARLVAAPAAPARQESAPPNDAQSGAAAAAATAAALAARRQAPKSEPVAQTKPAPVREPARPEPAAALEPETVPQSEAAELPDLLERVRASWDAIREEVGRRRKPAEIMLTEARVLALEDNTLTLGHTTGALAERLNAGDNNKAIVGAITAELGVNLAVKCVVGTKGASASVPRPKVPDRDDEQESESFTWGAPQPIGQDPDWRGRIEQATQVARKREQTQFSTGVPLPPDPGPDEEQAPPEPVRDEEEEMMADAAQEVGEHDHRSSTEIAMELLTQELGARRL